MTFFTNCKSLEGLKYAADHDDAETENYSLLLWDRYCTTGKIDG